MKTEYWPFIILGIGAVAFGITLLYKKNESENDTTIIGTIIDSVTSAPINGATVRVHDFGIPPSGAYSIDKSTKTDSNGNYTISLLLSSIYVSPDWIGDGRGVTIEVVDTFGYHPAEVNTIIYAGENIRNISIDKI